MNLGETLNKLEVTLIINDEVEGWELEDFFDNDPDSSKEIWQFAPTNFYLCVESHDGEPLEWYEVQPVDVTCTVWERVDTNE